MQTHPIVRCRHTLAANASAHPLDVVKIKSALQALGHYDVPEWGVSPYPDAALFDAIKAFQKSQGLSVDGAIKPDGETEAALTQAMTPHRTQTAIRAAAQALQEMGRGGDEILAHITPDEATLLHQITDGMSINPSTGLMEFSLGTAPTDDAPGMDDLSGWSDSLVDAGSVDFGSGMNTSGGDNDDSAKTASMWGEKTPEEKEYEKKMQQWHPGYKYGGNNLGLKGNNTYGTKGSVRAGRDALGAEAAKRGGQALSTFSKNKAAKAAGKALTSYGKSLENKFNSPEYDPNEPGFFTPSWFDEWYEEEKKKHQW